MEPVTALAEREFAVVAMDFYPDYTGMDSEHRISSVSGSKEPGTTLTGRARSFKLT
jgi:hypothetical protein